MGKRRRETWTFQPDDDIAELLNRILGDSPSRGERTQFINDAIRFQYPETAIISAENEITEAKARLERLKVILAKIKAVNSSGSRASILVSAESKLQRGSKAGQTKPREVERVPKSQQE